MKKIDTMGDSGLKSKFLEGHIEQEALNEQFLVDGEQKIIDSSLAINCEQHNKPAVFFS